MQGHDDIEQAIRAALEREPRVNLHRSPVSIRRVENGTVILMGAVANIEEKRVAVSRASAVDGVDRIIDRLHLSQRMPMEDGALRDLVCRHLFEESAFYRTTIHCRVDGDKDVIMRQPDGAEGFIDAIVGQGCITLRGQVLSLSHKRLAGVLAWWVPGCCDVVNALDIEPAEEDNDDELCDAIRIVLDKDPLLRADQVGLQVKNGRVTLRGVVTSEEEKRMVSQDVWYVDGVEDVANELLVMPSSPKPKAARTETPRFV